MELWRDRTRVVVAVSKHGFREISVDRVAPEETRIGTSRLPHEGCRRGLPVREAGPHDARPGVGVVAPVDSDDGPFSEFAVQLRDVAAVVLSNTGAFWTKVTIEDVHLEGPAVDPRLVILLRTEEHPASLYGLRAKVSDYHPEDGDPESWAGYIHDEVMEAVDAAPGLPDPTGAVTWVDL